MRILLDAMGGDNAPVEIVKGAYAAAADYPTRITLIGNEKEICDIVDSYCLKDDFGRIDIIHTDEFITMEDTPLSVVRDKRKSSMTKGLQMLHADEGDAFVSAGNTGALHTGATLIVRRIKGVKKSAIATILPFENPLLLMDSGANLEVTPDVLYQFAKMGSVYMNKIFNMNNVRIGLLNIGAESHKGFKLQQDTYSLLSQAEDINFAGNIESRDIPFGKCDVLVTDGFTGNIVLKYSEGLSKFIVGKVKDVCTKNILTKASSLTLQKGIKDLKKSFDASEYGGAPLLGLTKPVIKAHGSSDESAIKNAIRQAVFCVNGNMVYDIAKSLNVIDNAETNTETERS